MSEDREPNLTPCCRAKYVDIGDYGRPVLVCDECGKHPYNSEIDKLRAELEKAKTALAVACRETWALGSENESLREANKRLRALCAARPIRPNYSLSHDPVGDRHDADVFDDWVVKIDAAGRGEARDT